MSTAPVDVALIAAGDATSSSRCQTTRSRMMIRTIRRTRPMIPPGSISASFLCNERPFRCGDRFDLGGSQSLRAASRSRCAHLVTTPTCPCSKRCRAVQPAGVDPARDFFKGSKCASPRQATARKSEKEALERQMTENAARCVKCRAVLALEDFPVHKASRSGRSSWCRECHRAAVRDWRDRNRNEENRRRRARSADLRKAV
jgi:hypothetical protein